MLHHIQQLDMCVCVCVSPGEDVFTWIWVCKCPKLSDHHTFLCDGSHVCICPDKSEKN